MKKGKYLFEKEPLRKHKNLTNDEIYEVKEFLEKRKLESNKPLTQRLVVNIKCKSPHQKELINSIKDNEITICYGPPGTGKTYLSCAQALKLLKGKKYIDKIYLVKSVTTLRNEEIGFLKGTMDDKMAPFMFSFINNFEKLIGKGLTRALKENGNIEYLPIAYMRGINIDNAVIIIDEAQNISIQNLKTIMTRLGENSRMVFLGDMKQKDIKNKKDSALEFLFEQFSNINKIGVVSFTLDDVVRNPLIKDIEEVFDRVEEKSKKESQPKDQPSQERSKTPLKYRWMRLKSSVQKLFK